MLQANHVLYPPAPYRATTSSFEGEYCFEKLIQMQEPVDVKNPFGRIPCSTLTPGVYSDARDKAAYELRLSDSPIGRCFQACSAGC